MKKSFSLVLTLLLLLCFINTASATELTKDKNGYPIYAVASKLVVSSDGKYSYVLDNNNGDAYFFGSLENDITVLTIPDEIDGHPIVGIEAIGVSSNGITAVEFGANVKNVFQHGLHITSSSSSKVPICNLKINEGFQYFSQNAGLEDSILQDNSVLVDCKIVVLPKSLEYIGSYGFSLNFAKTVVIQSNVAAQQRSVTFCNESDTDSQKDIYLAESVTNLSPLAFDYDERIHNEEEQPAIRPSESVVLYCKSLKEGTEHFSGETYQSALLQADEGWSVLQGQTLSDELLNLPNGYTVKEYTEEWWHDLAEIETVTMTAEGMTEITENKGKSLSDAAKKYLSHEYEKSVKSGETFTVSSAFAPADAYDNRTFFVSMNEDIATVDIETGEVKALKKGTVRIRCVAASGVFADCILTVDGGDGTNGVKPTEAEVEANDTTSAATTAAKTDTPTATQSQTQPNKALSFLADKKFYIIPAAVVLTAAVVAGCIIRKKKR